eukprot:152883-Rhodomonas_salina.1
MVAKGEWGCPDPSAVSLEFREPSAGPGSGPSCSSPASTEIPAAAQGLLQRTDRHRFECSAVMVVA